MRQLLHSRFKHFGLENLKLLTNCARFCNRLRYFVAIEVNAVIRDSDSCFLLNLAQQIFGKLNVNVHNLVGIQAVNVAVGIAHIAV